MELSWLNRRNNPECIVFFNGWGMDPCPFTDIPCGRLDLLMAWDYRSLDSLPLDLLGQYQAVHLVAWSMGVWAAGTMLHKAADIFTSTTAIGGTLDPIHDRLGLPAAAYDSMVNNFTPAALAAFHLSMFDSSSEHQRFLEQKPHRSNRELCSELNALRTAYQERGAAANIFTHVLVTSRDQVFPARNQLRSWKGTNIIRTDWAHFPFYTMADWRTLLPINTKK